MFTASEKRKSNIAEYLLYMWQIEDIIRANDLDIEKIERNVIDHYDIDPARRKQLVEWYESLIDMMRREGVEKSGHLQMNKGVMADLVRLHQALLADPEFADYTAKFYQVLPTIVELRSKSGEGAKPGEIETCFNALYGMLMMRLSHREITPATAEAIGSIARFIAVLSHNYALDEEGKLFRTDDADAAEAPVAGSQA